MKSIDEAGVKWHLLHPDADKEETWKAGANYVIEQIEQLIYEKHVEGNLPLFDLTHLIDKLKEK